MKIFTYDTIKALQKAAIERLGISHSDFVGHIGTQVADEIVSAFKSSVRTVIFAGPDDCGAFVMTAARLLGRQHGFRPEVYLFNIGGNRLNDVCAEASALYKAEMPEESITEVTGLRFAMPELDEDTLVIDGLFGSSHTGPLSGGYQHLVRNINESGATIVSIDVPSGLPADPTIGLINRNIIHADVTLAIAAPRLSFFSSENLELVGRWKIIDGGITREDMRRAKSNFYLIEESDIRGILPERRPDCSKADFGSAIIFAGSYGMMGAAILATRAAARSGCGKVTCHSPRCGFGVMQISVPSALFEADSSDTAISAIELRRNYNAVAIGPGIGTADQTLRALEDFLKVAAANRRPVILDADALNCIAIKPAILNYLPMLSVLTPHAGEFDRMFGPQPSSSARLAKAIEIAQLYKIIIVLKGHYTAIVRPDGKVLYNSSGTTALATAGSGDVLTGLMAGFLAQGYKPEIASVVAVYVHGIAGRVAERRNGSYGTTAEDVADSVGPAIRNIMTQS